VLGSGFRSGGSYSGPISVLSATVMLTSAESAELFSAAALEPWSEAFVIRLANVGEDVTFGYSGSPITGALSASLSSENGTLSVGAMPIQVELQNCPEPGTLGLLLMGLMASLWLKWRANRVPFAILREGVVRREGSRITARAGYTEICFPNERYRDN
jgi:hypothetical protein